MATLDDYRQLTKEILLYLEKSTPFKYGGVRDFEDGLIRVYFDAHNDEIDIEARRWVNSPDEFFNLLKDQGLNYFTVRCPDQGDEVKAYEVIWDDNGKAAELVTILGKQWSDRDLNRQKVKETPFELVVRELAEGNIVASKTEVIGFPPRGSVEMSSEGRDASLIIVTFKIGAHAVDDFGPAFTSAVSQAVSLALWMRNESLLERIVGVEKRLGQHLNQDISRLVSQYLFD